MPEHVAGPQRRRRADVVIIVASAYALSAGTWFPPEMISGGGSRDVMFGTWLLAAYALGGALGFGGIFVALKRPALARGMVALAGLLVLSGFFALRQITALALASLGLTGLALLAAAPFMGKMPTPEEEGKER